jgi:hypothetical protein
MKTYTAIKLWELTGITPHVISLVMRKDGRGKPYRGPWTKRGKRPLVYTEADLRWFLKRRKPGRAGESRTWYDKNPGETPERRHERYKKSVSGKAGKIRDMIKQKAVKKA